MILPVAGKPESPRNSCHNYKYIVCNNNGKFVNIILKGE